MIKYREKTNVSQLNVDKSLWIFLLVKFSIKSIGTSSATAEVLLLGKFLINLGRENKETRHLFPKEIHLILD